MRLQTPHPDQTQLQALLRSGLSEPAQSEVVAHLTSCEGCRTALEKMAGPTPLPDAVRRATPQPPPSNSAFWPALQEIKQEIAPSASVTAAVPGVTPTKDDLSLDFLTPAEEPEYKGKLGDYRVVEVIGRGGMGVVFRALDRCLQRHVAIKVLDPHFAQDEVARQRFFREARAAAAVTHENVVAIHQVAVEEKKNLPYLVMQHVSGESLQDRLDRGPKLTVGEILRIGAQAAAGLAAAHSQGLVHRDIKPANILLVKLEGNAGDSLATVKITDFGLARAAQDVHLTQTGFVAGTPLYMAPEQANGEVIDHRTDLFSLGSVLYAMCTGKPPFEGSTPFAVLQRVTQEVPRPIHSVNPEIPEPLVAVIDKLMAKKPEDRFQSAVEVAAILSRMLAKWQSAHPMACPKSLHKARVGRRTDARLLAAGAALVLLLGGLAFTEGSRLTHLVSGLTGLDFSRPEAGPRAEAGPTPGRAPRIPLNGSAGPVWSAAFSPKGDLLAMAIDDGTVKLWDPDEGRLRFTRSPHRGPVWSVAFSPRGDLLATASDDGTAKILDPLTGDERHVLKHTTSVRAVAFSPDGKTVVTGSREGRVRFWDVATGSETVTTKGHAGVVVAVAFSPDGKTVASGSGDKTIKLWDASSGQEQATLSGQAGVYAVAFSPDSKRLASGGWDKLVRLWNVANGEQEATLKGHTQDVWSVAFSPDGKLLASASEDHTVKLWDLTTGRERETFTDHTGTVYAVTFSRDSRWVASGGRDGSVKIWDVAP
jgi:serine/threonine protein kinase